MRTVGELALALERIAPRELAEPWDNVGLLAGLDAAPLRGPVVLTIDLSAGVAEEAVGARASAVVAYHPPIFAPLRRLGQGAGTRGEALQRVLAAGMALYSPHTALDAAPGGVTDWLADGVAGAGGEAGPRRVLRPHQSLRPGEELKVVTFLPAEAADGVRAALAGAGAGRIGGYTLCSFAAPGTGTFVGGPGTSPAVGEAGRLERVSELRLEMVCAPGDLLAVLEALRRAHPYEQPGVDVYQVVARPQADVGAGRVVELARPMGAEGIAANLKRHLGVEGVLVARAPGGTGSAERVGVCPGSGFALAEAAARAGCGVYVAGEMKHHDVLACLDLGLSVVLAGHTETERGYLPVLARRLEAELPGVEVVVSGADRSPGRWV
ncbi:MAG TPA: Nif3-like dinuclear metal center hexameric protein [Phycisphaerales bacterium]|nr:Nif3-like dinuclear metal center hexameric protein [Phycisphaerales bacterium]